MVSSDRNRGVDPRVRPAIAQRPDDAPRGAVTTLWLSICLTQDVLRPAAPSPPGGAGGGA